MMGWINWVVASLRTSVLAFMLWGSFFLAGKYFAFYQKPLNQQIIIGLACLIVNSAVYVFLLDWYYRWRFRIYRRLPDSAISALAKTSFEIGIVLFSLINIVGGIILLYSSPPVAVFFGAFLCFTGAQILLWRLGLGLEIISNVPSVIDPPKANID